MIRYQMKILSVLALCAIITICLGCGNSKEIKEAKSKYELSQANADLDGMFLALKQLIDFGEDVDNNKKLLSEVSSAIKARQNMELAISNHDHELAIISAATLLKVVPNHVKATKTLLESGQIYSRLEKALKLVNEAISTKKDESGECSFIFPQREVEKNEEQLSQERRKNNTDDYLRHKPHRSVYCRKR